MLTGTRIGVYQIQSLLGAGAMGEVYRARDPKLQRDVAIKILPASFATDPDRLRRFEREAQLLAALNHPHIGAIYGFEDAAGVHALVLELVEGETLAERLATGPIPMRAAVSFACQIADALESAHDTGIIHRDLKPANIKLTAGGTIKVLDFGLAKAFGREAAGGDPSQSPTITSAATRDGAVLGTPVYMSPEQVRGRSTDKRADIWAFGCVLFEMLTARMAFAGDTASDTLSAVLVREPDWALLPADTPASVRRLLHRCLEKDPRRRLHDIGDARIELEDTLNGQDAAVSPRGSAAPARSWRALAIVSVITAAALLAALAASWPRGREPSPPSLAQFVVPLPGLPLSGPQISPDGKYVAVVIADGTLQGRLWVRPIASLSAREVADAETYREIFWSPDSRLIAYWRGQKLMTVPADGGLPQIVGTFPSNNMIGGGAWSADGTILIADKDNMISRISAGSDRAAPVIRADAASGVQSQALPAFLPDRQQFLYFARASDDTQSGVFVGSIRGERRLVLRSPRTALYASPGYLLFRQQDQLVARRFDPQQMILTGETIPLGLKASGSTVGALWASASLNGILVTGVARDPEGILAWVDRRGSILKRYSAQGQFHDLSISPDESRLAFNQGLTPDIWRVDLERGGVTKLTNSPEADWATSWEPGGRMLAFTIGNDLYTMPADGSAPPTLVRQNDVLTWCTDWYGRHLVCQRWSPATLWNLVLVDLDAPQTLTPIAPSEFHEMHGRFSPDGKWIAYTSDESGRFEVYLHALGAGGKIPVSVGGGAFPRWRADGREIYYMAPDASLTAAGVQWSQGVPRIGTPLKLFTTDHPDRSYAGTDYVPSRDGQKFLVTLPAAPTSSPALVVTINWPELLRR